MWLMTRTALKKPRRSRLTGLVCGLACGLWMMPLAAQDAAQAMLDADAQAQALGRDFNAQPFAPARASHESALTTQAIQLLDFCNNPAVASDFVAMRLERFSKMSGREEDCKSLRDYWPQKGGLSVGSSAPLPERGR